MTSNPATAAAPAVGSGAKTLVMTGGTSGFGRRMVMRLLAEKPDWRVFLLARSPEKAADIMQLPGAQGRLTIVTADLASLKSVAKAADSIEAALGGQRIDAMAFNAGLQAILTDQASAEGIELSFAVNHLAHYLLAERLLPRVRDGGRLVLTSSIVHNPETYCVVGITRATWEDPAIMADAAKAQDHMKERVDRGEARYSASKLLNLMHARHLAKAVPRVATLAFNPNIVPGTEIARERNIFQILGWKYIMPLMAPVLPTVRTQDTSAGDLLWLVTEADAGKFSGQYLDGRQPMPGSDESRDAAKIARVIEVSDALLAKHGFKASAQR